MTKTTTVNTAAAKEVFAPGCALMLYKPHLAAKLSQFFNDKIGDIPDHMICCKHEPKLEKGTRIINVCSGCNKRFKELYEGISTISLWEVLAENNAFPFPDYGGAEMTLHDTCPTRSETVVHDAVRALLKKMNISLKEPKETGTKSFCCGDSLYGSIPVEQLKEHMKVRADSMPCDNVVVYCVSCIKSMYIGGKKPRHLIDLLFNESTHPGEYEQDAWHGQLQKYIDAH